MERCKYPECMRCLDHCPSNAIDFSISPPIFKSDCQLDYLYEGVCPTGAIEVDWEPPYKTRGLNSRLFIKFLKEDEAKGRFRWLVPEYKIGWDTPLYKITGHPRYISEDD